MANNLYGSYDAFVGGGAGGPDLYGSYDAMPGAPQGGGGFGGGNMGGGMGMGGGNMYNSYDMAMGGGGGGMYNSYDMAMGGGMGGGGMGGGYQDMGGMGGGMGGMGGGQMGGGMGGPQYGQQGGGNDYQDIRGVGITFDQQPSSTGHSNVYVKSVSSGSSADRSGKVRRGDTLIRVNGIDVTGRPIAQLRPVIPGPAGSVVRLGFRRYDGSIYECDLVRSTPRLGTKSNRYFGSAGAARVGGFRPPNNNNMMMQQQQQMYQQQMMQQQMMQHQMMQQQMYQQPMISYDQTYAQQPISYVQPMGVQSVGYVDQGVSYVQAPQQVSYVTAPQQSVQYVQSGVQQVSYQPTQQVAYTQSTSYQDVRPEEIKGTQV